MFMQPVGCTPLCSTEDVVFAELPQTPDDDLRSARATPGRRKS